VAAIAHLTTWLLPRVKLPLAQKANGRLTRGASPVRRRSRVHALLDLTGVPTDTHAW